MSDATIGRPMEILLVEDSLVDARFAIGSLKQGDIRHRLTLVRDGQEAVAFLRREGVFARAPRPDLILLDLLLPIMNGVEVLAAVREDDGLYDIPVVNHLHSVRIGTLHVPGFRIDEIQIHRPRSGQACVTTQSVVTRDFRFDASLALNRLLAANPRAERC